jgi:hypothetical protein
VVWLLNIPLFLCCSRNKNTVVSSIPKGETTTLPENRGLWPVPFSSKGEQSLLLLHYVAGEENTEPSQNKRKDS